MQPFQAPVPARLVKGFAAIAALVVGISLESGSHIQVVSAQTLLVENSVGSPGSAATLEPPSLPSRFCPSDLAATIATIIGTPTFRTAQWGILIKPVSEATVLYEQNPDLALIPASNIKLLTTAAALRIMGDRDPAKLASFSRWLTGVNRYSDNQQADSLLRRIGGQSAARLALATLGVNAEGFRQVDGSGLSRSNRATPSALVTVLQSMYTGNLKGMPATSEGELFFSSLAIAGVNGTLRNRFHNTPVQGRLHGKTGTLRGVRALSGYLENSDYGTIAFSIVVNQPGQPGQNLVQAIDQIVLNLAQVNRCDARL